MKNIHIIALILISLLADFSSHAQPCKIIGTITDRNTGTALIGANAIIAGTNRGAATNIDGEFVIKSMQPGEYTIRGLYIGYYSDSVRVVLLPGDSATVDIRLTDLPLIPYTICYISPERPFDSPQTRTGTITGMIRDEEAGHPLVAANVLIVGTSTGAVTNAEGTFVLDSLRPGKYTLYFGDLGYESDTLDVPIAPGDVVDVQVALRQLYAVPGYHPYFMPKLIRRRPDSRVVLDDRDPTMNFYGIRP